MNKQKNDVAGPVAGIILAAGSASRMGQPKLLLPWKGEMLIRHSARIALSCLEPVIVVTGAWATETQDALTGLAVQVIHNPEWETGQSTSVRAGINALPEQTAAAIFLQGDQPYISTELIQNLVKSYKQTRPTILAPYVGGKRSNPVLFDRSIFKVLCQLQGDAGARSIFAQYPPTSLIWSDERLLFDVDTPEDYQKLIEDV
jgi:molybdenum cofactor cytidylyltransferase